jgi:GNAT superfamily N-acetyltransferase
LASHEASAVIRPRQDEDLPALAKLLEVIQPLEGYPKSRPESLENFVRDERVISAWVVEEQGVVVGHALIKEQLVGGIDDIVHRHTGWPKDRLAAVSRVFVSPETRGKGYARQLLRHCVQEARRRDLLPYLDVDTQTPAPRALYASEGWQSLEITTVTFPSGVTLELDVLVLPEA